MKLTLDNVALTEDFFTDTRLLGIVAPVSNYRFCWMFNNSLGYNFRLDCDLEITLRRKKRQYYFSVYCHKENDYLSFYLFHNQCDGEYLLPEFRHIDFLLLMKGDDVEDEKCNDIINSIRTLSSVQMVMELTNEQIKNKEHLVF